MSILAPDASAWSTARVDTVLAEFVAAGILGHFEVQLAAAALRAAPTASDGALLALGLVARATRLGHVCVDLDQIRLQVAAAGDDVGRSGDLTVPDLATWIGELERSDLVATAGTAGASPLRPMVWDGRRLYLQRYWSFEIAVADAVARRQDEEGIDLGEAPAAGDVDDALDTVFPRVPGGSEDGPDLQRAAARRALIHRVSVIAGGPGTGKTHTVAAILVAGTHLSESRGLVLRAALAAPTGKAAARMQEAVEERVEALVDAAVVDQGRAEAILASRPTTIHRLLGSLGRSGFRHDRDNPLPHDLVIIDETSMVSLPLLARLLDALRPTARLVLVGDPFQLSSIEAGTVMADLVGPWNGASTDDASPLRDRVTELVRGRRFESGSSVADLALAIRKGDGDGVIELLGSGRPQVHWVRPENPDELAALRSVVAAAAHEIVAAAVAGRADVALTAATRIKVLAAVRRGPNGLDEWSDAIGIEVQGAVPIGLRGGWPRLGTPVMVTSNDPFNHLANGDVGVVVHEDGRWVVMQGTEPRRRLAPARLGAWEPWWAMTIHKSQGSEFPHAVVALPTVDSPILTRELLYTAVTRAKPEVTIVGSEAMVRLAVARPVARASGLRDRLWPEV